MGAGYLRPGHIQYSLMTPLWLFSTCNIRDAANSRPVMHIEAQQLPRKQGVPKATIVVLLLTWLWLKEDSREYLVDLFCAIDIDIS